MLGYELDEPDAWALPMEQVEKAVAGAKAGACGARAVVINPGNPTGNSLLRQDMEEIVTFAPRRSSCSSPTGVDCRPRPADG